MRLLRFLEIPGTNIFCYRIILMKNYFIWHDSASYRQIAKRSHFIMVQLSYLFLLLTLPVPIEHLFNSFLDFYFMLPAKSMQFTDISEFAHGPIGF